MPNLTLEQYRDFLKDNIRLTIDFSKTDQSKGYPLPSIEKRIELAIDLTEGMDPSAAAAVLYDYIGADVACVSSIPTVFGLFHTAGGDPTEAIIAASNLGGDTDTIASMVGSIAGALKGIDAFPLEMVNQVEEESDLDLKDVALKLIEHSKG